MTDIQPEATGARAILARVHPPEAVHDAAQALSQACRAWRPVPVTSNMPEGRQPPTTEARLCMVFDPHTLVVDEQQAQGMWLPAGLTVALLMAVVVVVSWLSRRRALVKERRRLAEQYRASTVNIERQVEKKLSELGAVR